MEKWSSGCGSVAARDAKRCSGYVRTVIEASAIAVALAARRPDGSSAVQPTGGTS